MHILNLIITKVYFHFKSKIYLLYLKYKGRPSQLRKAIKKAQALHIADKRRYRVFFFGNEYKVWTRTDLRSQQHEKILKWGKKEADWNSVCFYDTLKPENYVSVKR
jgi:hypothetical protein